MGNFARVIKNNRSGTRAVEAVEPSLLDSGPRIPRRVVASELPPIDESAALRLKRLLRPGQTEHVSEPVQVVTDVLARMPSSRFGGNARDEGPSPEQLEALVREQRERELESLRAEAYEAGRSAVRAEMQEQFDEVLQEFVESLSAIQGSWESHLRQSEPHLVQLAFRIARAILDSPLPDDVRRVSEATISEAVERMATGVAIEIVLHPTSFQRMKDSGLDDHLMAMHNRLRWRTNPEMRLNEWIVQTSRSTTRRLEAELLDKLQRDLSLRDVNRNDQDAEETDGNSDTLH